MANFETETTTTRRYSFNGADLAACMIRYLVATLEGNKKKKLGFTNNDDPGRPRKPNPTQNFEHDSSDLTFSNHFRPNTFQR